MELKLRLGIIDNDIVNWISAHPEILLNSLPQEEIAPPQVFNPKYTTEFGSLYQADCIPLMKTIPSDSIDMIFADPPFNIGKNYKSGVSDKLSEDDYLNWTESWLKECIRILAPGGSLFVYNLPHWQTHIAGMLNKYLTFRHWIAVYMRGLIPVAGKLHPSHYGLLYYTKGERPRVFNKQRIPMSTCRHCGGEIHDYGGKKRGLNENGLSIADVWTDIHPVRHKKFKNRDSNELPIKMLYRIISLASNEGDLVFDPFGGSGTTYTVAEHLRRRWIGCEIGDINPIVSRIQNNEDLSLLHKVEQESNVLFTQEQVTLRRTNDFWLLEDFT
ncbi:DNA-methyltransferase [Desulfitobacterium hafniense]|uniref:DNA-methyltransferase n=1 Tax=Desulfitobacterium hafniense TaxID=49338 RepID=UPI001AD7F100|nr:site-specific DNA-methyltransferase [Desulfitobacterium hafniense]